MWETYSACCDEHMAVKLLTHLISKENRRIKAPESSWIANITQWKQIFSVFSPTQKYIFFYVYWTVHYCDNWRIKNQLDATCYFIVLLIGSTWFGHYYAHHQELATMMLITTLVLSFLGWCMLEVRCGWAGVVSGSRPATQTLLQPNRTSPPTYSKPRTKRPMW